MSVPAEPQAQEHVPDSEGVRSLRAVLNTLGDGFVEAVDERTLLPIAANQPSCAHFERVRGPLLRAKALRGRGISFGTVFRS